ncbi:MULTISPECIES: Cof-type HAD-IIB family hydrolase [Tenebrionibacter/Tenebrionicola group]|jgi:Cof subfamily protein (haloacid dehalogenase superfamily)|uniref:HAD family hydrolase n=2 Tax=Tenebrionibacter/Tenebrionicola group TaxID=2969848 RepID=A0A8K0V175_9ENTR|nr:MULTISPECIES: Cof-type HAD-IIB family hydrolase [Tenebrionibacter/Tenebrionicola group]MBK4714806.1 HAD family hydrolase [Tenebrionibacter intestinalis]MBV4412257.1 HAD family hydrolase [Tenebrionicola larvae]MBV5095551.1 HAD family hydrolase [Tenebrionicola larvae]
MPVKMIAVDMDGTFLNDDKRYNRARFLTQYARMKEQGIRFVVASGNQYWQLISFFPEIASEIAFVAENGGWIVCEGEDLYNGALSRDQYATMVDHLLTLPDVEIIAAGKEKGWTLRRYNDSFHRMAAKYYHRLERVDDFFTIDDTFFKFALNLPDNRLQQTMRDLQKKLGDIMVPVTSGHGSIDLIIPGLHKANGLRILQQRWGIEDREVLAFGDGGNDTEMLCQAGFGFVMANAPDNIRALTCYEAPHNNQEGVLEIIEKALNGEAPFA